MQRQPTMIYKPNSQWTWDYLMSFAKRLADLRKGHDLTQRQMASLAGVHVSQIRRYEAGGAQPTLTVIRNIAVGLHITTDELAFDDEERAPNTDDLKLFFEAVSEFDEADKNVAMQLLRGLIIQHQNKKLSNMMDTGKQVPAE